MLSSQTHSQTLGRITANQEPFLPGQRAEKKGSVFPTLGVHSSEPKSDIHPHPENPQRSDHSMACVHTHTHVHACARTQTNMQGHSILLPCPGAGDLERSHSQLQTKAGKF